VPSLLGEAAWGRCRATRSSIAHPHPHAVLLIFGSIS